MLELGFLLIAWPLCVLLSATIAWSKGKSGCMFAILAILFGPLALLAAIAMSVEPGAETKRLLRIGKYVRCVWCREPVLLGATVCPHCRRDNP
jgi:hypothetical protein